MKRRLSWPLNEDLQILRAVPWNCRITRLVRLTQSITLSSVPPIVYPHPLKQINKCLKLFYRFQIIITALKVLLIIGYVINVANMYPLLIFIHLFIIDPLLIFDLSS